MTIIISSRNNENYSRYLYNQETSAYEKGFIWILLSIHCKKYAFNL